MIGNVGGVRGVGGAEVGEHRGHPNEIRRTHMRVWVGASEYSGTGGCGQHVRVGKAAQDDGNDVGCCGVVEPGVQLVKVTVELLSVYLRAGLEGQVGV